MPFVEKSQGDFSINVLILNPHGSRHCMLQNDPKDHYNLAVECRFAYENKTIPHSAEFASSTGHSCTSNDDASQSTCEDSFPDSV